MKLYGSTTSPYVRRIRIVLFSTEHEFLNLQIFSGEDRALLASRNPTLKVPCLEDDGEMIFDSRVIYNYLAEKLDHDGLSWEEEIISLFCSCSALYFALYFCWQYCGGKRR